LLEPIASDKVVFNMRKFRLVAMVLILVLASSPALAAICATTCASLSAMTALHSNDMTEMQHCHEGSMGTHTNKPSAEHKSCVMGATCHFAQVISQVDSLSKYVFAGLTRLSFPEFTPFEKSIDLSPPLKPPA
jgi:hypothetical protein